jgi:hypothetical protein
MPGANAVEITKRVVEAINAPEPEKLMLPEEEMQAPPDPKAIEIQAKIEMDGRRLEMDLNAHMLDIEERIARIEQIKADTMLKLAQAEAQEAGQQFELYKSQMDMIAGQAKMQADLIKAKMQQQTALQRGEQNGGGRGNQPGGMGGMEAQPSDAEVLPPDTGDLLAGGGDPAGGVMLPGQPGANGPGLREPGGLPVGDEGVL